MEVVTSPPSVVSRTSSTSKVGTGHIVAQYSFDDIISETFSLEGITQWCLQAKNAVEAGSDVFVRECAVDNTKQLFYVYSLSALPDDDGEPNENAELVVIRPEEDETLCVTVDSMEEGAVLYLDTCTEDNPGQVFLRVFNQEPVCEFYYATENDLIVSAERREGSLVVLSNDSSSVATWCLDE